MATVFKMTALILSLGIDTLIVSTSLGVARVQGKLKIVLVFATAETLMPLIGLLIGQGAGRVIGHFANVAGGLALIALAVWLIFFAEEDGEEQRLAHNLMGWTLVTTAVGISLDELAVGFSMGLIGVPIGLTIALIALQSLAFTTAGLTFGRKFKPYLGEWSEKLAGVALGLLGVWIMLDAVVFQP